jgi:hypothetical protein
MGLGEAPQNKKGFQIDIPVEKPQGLIIGGSTSYNEDVSARLIVGTQRVDEYLEKQDLTVTRKTRPKIPQF